MSFSSSLDAFLSVVETDESTARRYLEASGWDAPSAVESYFNQSAPPPIPDETIRPPIPSKVEALIGGDPGNHPGIRYGREQPFRSADETDSRLSMIFQPPVESLFPGSFEEMIAIAKSSSRWVLVNIQDSSFQSCVLNRDVWSNDVIRTLIREHGFFWQRNQGTEQGNKFLAYYPASALPSVSLIDPMTGQRLSEWGPELTAETLIAKLTEQTAGKSPGKSSRHDFESRQIEEAIVASLSEKPPKRLARERPVVISSDDDSTDEDGIDGWFIPPKIVPTVPKEPSPPPEPPEGPDTTKVQMRMPDGQRIVRRFLRNHTVGDVHCVVKKQVGDKAFTLILLPNKMLSDMQVSLEAAGLISASVAVRWA